MRKHFITTFLNNKCKDNKFYCFIKNIARWMYYYPLLRLKGNSRGITVWAIKHKGGPYE